MFNNIEVLSNELHYYAPLYREAIESHKHNNCYNKKEEALKISKTWFWFKMCTVKPVFLSRNSMLTQKLLNKTEMRWTSHKESIYIHMQGENFST